MGALDRRSRESVIGSVDMVSSRSREGFWSRWYNSGDRTAPFHVIDWEVDHEHGDCDRGPLHAGRLARHA